MGKYRIGLYEWTGNRYPFAAGRYPFSAVRYQLSAIRFRFYNESLDIVELEISMF